MKLTQFTNHLFLKGEITVESTLKPADKGDLLTALTQLWQFHDHDALQMPHQAPKFHSQAAKWALQYLYRAVQLIMLRDLGEEEVLENLKQYPGEKNAEAIYTVDLLFRYLPDLLSFAKRLAPNDPLVKCLKETAKQWPFSSVGMDVEGELETAPIMAHPSLSIAYIDRIIDKKAKKRITNDQIRSKIQEALGNHTETFEREQLIS